MCVCVCVCVCVILLKNFIDFLIFAIIRETFNFFLVFQHFDFLFLDLTQNIYAEPWLKKKVYYVVK